MKRFPELKPNFWDVIVVLAVIALAALSAMTVWRGGTETGALTAVVTADGQEIDRFAPADLLDAPRTYSYNGVTLTVAAEDGNGLRVSSSDCPTQDCVHTGTISRSGQSIVCLPARIVIQLTGGAADSSGVYVYDDAALLTQEEYDTLTASAMAVADQYGCGVYVVTVDDMADYIDPDAVTETGETGMAAFTEYAWDALGLAASYDSNGIMLALSMAERDFQMLAHGDTANAAFTDYGKYIMQDEFLDNFREDDWYGGFADYIAACGRYLEANANGTPIDVEPSDETEEEYEPLSFGDKLFFAALMAFRFGLPLGLIVAFIVCAIYKRQLKSVRRATEAARYTVSGGAEITAREDRFTHTTEVRTPIKTESDDHDSGPSFSGGTTVNSGGFSHSGGKF